MEKPVLLTGAGGRVGQAILSRLAESDEWRLLGNRFTVEEAPLARLRLPREGGLPAAAATARQQDRLPHSPQ